MKKRILVADDEMSIRLVLSRLLKKSGYDVEQAEDGNQCLAAAGAFQPDLILMDLRMPNKDGLATLQELQEQKNDAKVIMMTAFGTIPNAVEAMRIGAYDYITKPFDNNELLLVVERALQHRALEEELNVARSRLEDKYSVAGIITRNREMLKILDTITRVASTNAPVLITGESGTGKELIANAVHQQSERKNRALVTLNCGALPQNLIESELFGYKRGAFSGADTSKRGLVEQAENGTLFLDEIAEMGPEAQAKLLRFAQSGEFIPLGSVQARTIDVRLIAATNRDLDKAVKAGDFRQDLFYRLNVVSLHIPPLRERPDDIVILLDHFLGLHSAKTGKTGYAFTPRAIDLLLAYRWPGNVRELENVVYSSLIRSVSPPIDIHDLPPALAQRTVPEPEAVRPANLSELTSSHLESLEIQAIREALTQCGGNRSKAAEHLNISRRTLLRKLKKYGIV